MAFLTDWNLRIVERSQEEKSLVVDQVAKVGEIEAYAPECD